MLSFRSTGLYLVGAITVVFASGCVYYNTFFMAKKKFNQAEKSQKENAEKKQLEFGQQDSQGGRAGQAPERPVPRGRERQPGQPEPSGRISTKANAQERALYDDAIKKASKVLTFHPDSKWADDALWLIGKSYYNMGDYPAADRKFKELVTNHPQSKFADDAYFYMGMSQVEMENEDLASETFQRIEREFKKSGYIDEIYFARGRLAVRGSDYQGAISLLGQYLERFPEEDSAAMAAFLMGDCHEALGDHYAAYQNYKRVEKYNPSRQLEFEAALASGSVLLRTDSTAAGMRILDDLAHDQRYFSQSARIRLKIAEGFDLQDDSEKAVAEYEAITTQNPKTAESAEAFYKLGLIYQNKLFDIEKAKESFGKVQSEFSSSEFRNLALAKSAQIAKFEAYRAQLQKADSVRTARETVRKTTSRTDSLSHMVPDSVSADSAFVGQPEAQRPDKIAELVPPGGEGDSTARIDKPISENSQIDFIGPLLESSNVSAEQEIYTVVDSGWTEIDSLAGDSTRTARSDSSSTEVVDEQAIIDSINANIAQRKAKEDSVRQAIIDEGIRTRFLLAELYAYELNQPDSALHEYLLIIEQYSDSPFSPKSLLAAANLKFSAADSNSAREYLRRLVEDYPRTPQAAMAARTLDCPFDFSNNAIGIYAQAENLLLGAENPDSAAILFGLVADNYPDLAPQASYARAYAIDMASDGSDSSAIFAYQAVSDKYPQTAYAESARQRLGQSQLSAPRRSSRPESKRPENRENKPDTTNSLAGGLPPAPPVKVPGEFVYPQSLLDRRLKGEVLFKIKINLFGKVEEHEIIGPSGEHAIDSSATAALLETEFDTSNYDLSSLQRYFRYSIPFERPDINIFNDPYREERRDPY